MKCRNNYLTLNTRASNSRLLCLSSVLKKSVDEQADLRLEEEANKDDEEKDAENQERQLRGRGYHGAEDLKVNEN